MVLRRIAPHLAAPALPLPRLSRHALAALETGRRRQALRSALWPRNLGRSHSLSPAAVRKLLPGIRETNLLGAVRYFDGLTTTPTGARHASVGRPARGNRAELHGIPGCRCRLARRGAAASAIAERGRNTTFRPAVSSTPGPVGSSNPAQQSAAAFDQGSAPGDRRGTAVFAQCRGDYG